MILDNNTCACNDASSYYTWCVWSCYWIIFFVFFCFVWGGAYWTFVSYNIWLNESSWKLHLMVPIYIYDSSSLIFFLLMTKKGEKILIKACVLNMNIFLRKWSYIFILTLCLVTGGVFVVLSCIYFCHHKKRRDCK